MSTCQAIHSLAILHYTLVEQKCLAGDIIKISTVYCLINICSYFVIISKFCIFIAVIRSSSWKGMIMANGYFTDVVVHSSKNYHQERATRPRRLNEDVAAVFGEVILRFHGDSNLYK
jgi:hypothetical protein